MHTGSFTHACTVLYPGVYNARVMYSCAAYNQQSIVKRNFAQRTAHAHAHHNEGNQNPEAPDTDGARDDWEHVSQVQSEPYMYELAQELPPTLPVLSLLTLPP